MFDSIIVKFFCGEKFSITYKHISLCISFVLININACEFFANLILKTSFEIPFIYREKNRNIKFLYYT